VSADSKVATNKEASALTDYNKIITINPKNGYAWEGRGIYYFKKKNYTAALEDLDKAVKYSPESGRAYFYRGAIRDMNGDKKGACADLQKAVDLKYEGAEAAKKRTCGDDEGAF